MDDVIRLSFPVTHKNLRGKVFKLPTSSYLKPLHVQLGHQVLIEGLDYLASGEDLVISTDQNLRVGDTITVVYHSDPRLEIFRELDKE